MNNSDICPACATEFELGTFKECGNQIISEVVLLRSKIEKLQHELKEASFAGTPYWKERDLQNSLIVRNQELENTLQTVLLVLKEFDYNRTNQ